MMSQASTTRDTDVSYPLISKINILYVSPQISQTSIDFDVHTTMAESTKKLRQDIDLVVVAYPQVVRNTRKCKPIPLKIHKCTAERQTCYPATIHLKIGVCTVEETENGVVVPQFSEILQKGGEVTLKFIKREGTLCWEFTSTGDTAEQQNAQTQTPPANDDFVIKNEYENTRLALCLIDQGGARLPIVDLGICSNGQQINVNGPLCVQAYVIAGQTVGMPLELTDADVKSGLLKEDMAVIDLPNYLFTLYPDLSGGQIKLEKSSRKRTEQES
ncbi:uncharacterized protein EDB93DRAFT_1185540 [Suillus bovinus]|uniref:uncharacterized protein n=1 Tax=Suillus bovinus TaxID=48563 RepID=UPI001B869BF1|nr:uncharacterized protein EDB93DRAFT_1185540 [Suillus bovinus]KAG2127927.1 hypothetical protein EDB93DRAFT_1185540 [Suillus bovinus]